MKLTKKKIDLEELIETWEKPLENVFPVARGKEDKSLEVKYKENIKVKTVDKIATPRVFIPPIFTGTHGEYDMERSFVEAGADVEPFVFKTLSLKDIDNSYKDMGRKIRDCQILALPNGAVLGNEPDGGGKLIAIY